MQKTDIFRRLLFVPIVAVVVAAVLRLDLAIRYLNKITEDIHIPTSSFAHYKPTKSSVKIKADSKEVPDKDRIDLNKAELSELDSLPEIGKARAEAIILQRAKMGGFYSVDDVLCTPGIGLKTLFEIKNMVTVSNEKL